MWGYSIHRKPGQDIIFKYLIHILPYFKLLDRWLRLWRCIYYVWFNFFQLLPEGVYLKMNSCPQRASAFYICWEQLLNFLCESCQVLDNHRGRNFCCFKATQLVIIRHGSLWRKACSIFIQNQKVLTVQGGEKNLSGPSNVFLLSVWVLRDLCSVIRDNRVALTSFLWWIFLLGTRGKLRSGSFSKAYATDFSILVLPSLFFQNKDEASGFLVFFLYSSFRIGQHVKHVHFTLMLSVRGACSPLD